MVLIFVALIERAQFCDHMKQRVKTREQQSNGFHGRKQSLRDSTRIVINDPFPTRPDNHAGDETLP